MSTVKAGHGSSGGEFNPIKFMAEGVEHVAVEPLVDTIKKAVEHGADFASHAKGGHGGGKKSHGH
ncbi:MAG: hypothetical protein M1333_00090 [Patescibacteria group bacterium]|nr:hypothetical protein [Patescibacteria group bacterium]